MTSSGKLFDKVKVDNGLLPKSLASTNDTGEFHPMADHERAAFLCQVAAMAAGNTAAFQVRQATDGAGAGAKDVTNALATITANSGVAAATVTATTVVNNNTIIINGVTFTAKTSGAVQANGEFNLGASDTDAMANLAATINALLPKLRATSSTNVLTVVARDPGEEKITFGAMSGTLVAATLRAAALVEIERSFLDHKNGFNYVAIKCTTSGTVVCSAGLIRGGPSRYSPVQKLAASKTDVS